jgi:hypothetical protein
LQIVWTAVAAATQLDPRNDGVHPTVTGTVNARVTPPTYTATPADALVVLDTGDVEVRAVVRSFAGNFARDSARDFFADDHDVDADVAIAGGAAFSVDSTLLRAVGARHGAGTLGDGHSFTFAATTTSTASFDSATVEYRATEARTATIVGDGVDLACDDDLAYHAVVVDHFAEDATNTVSVTGTAAGARWSLNGGVLKRTFSDGLAVEPDFWTQTHGVVRRDDVDFATLGARVSLDRIELVVDAGAAGARVLESNPRR